MGVCPSGGSVGAKNEFGGMDHSNIVYIREVMLYDLIHFPPRISECCPCPLLPSPFRGDPYDCTYTAFNFCRFILMCSVSIYRSVCCKKSTLCVFCLQDQVAKALLASTVRCSCEG